MLLIKNLSVPDECRDDVYIDGCDDDGNGVFEQRFLPSLYFQASAGIGFIDEAVPAPAYPMTVKKYVKLRQCILTFYPIQCIIYLSIYYMHMFYLLV